MLKDPTQHLCVKYVLYPFLIGTFFMRAETRSRILNTVPTAKSDARNTNIEK